MTAPETKEQKREPLWDKWMRHRAEKKAAKVEAAKKELKELAEGLKPPAHLAEESHAVIEAAPPSPPVIAVPVSTSALPPESNPLEELAISDGIEIELTKIRKDKDGKDKRVVIVRGKCYIRPRRTQKDIFSFDWRENTYYINPKKIIEVRVKPGRRNKSATKLKLVYDIMYSEPLNPDGSITWDQEWEDILTDEAMDQYILACVFESKFELTRGIIILAVLVGLFMLPLGIVLNAVYHVIPTTQIHWFR